ncbi:hypothetical protein [Bacteroides gallinarum]|uniref:hypothetical protein n=1 Tax=Bacteroides gallinarum TaxID=376806 RepID=UPI001F49912C|nr:hypothetical protein [Bacteroides gallinarum]
MSPSSRSASGKPLKYCLDLLSLRPEYGVLVTAVQFLQPREHLVCRAGRDTQFPVVPAFTDNVPPVDSQAPAGKVYLEFCAALDGTDSFLIDVVHGFVAGCCLKAIRLTFRFSLIMKRLPHSQTIWVSVTRFTTRVTSSWLV